MVNPLWNEYGTKQSQNILRYYPCTGFNVLSYQLKLYQKRHSICFHRSMNRMGEERGVYRVLAGKPEGKRPLGRPRRRWVDKIRTDLQEVGCGYMDWTGLAQDKDRCRTLVSAVMNIRVPWNAGIFLTSYKPVSFSRRTLHHGISK